MHIPSPCATFTLLKLQCVINLEASLSGRYVPLPILKGSAKVGLSLLLCCPSLVWFVYLNCVSFVPTVHDIFRVRI